MELNPSAPLKGLSLDAVSSQLEEGSYTLMLNGLLESHDHSYTGTNEPSTAKLVNLKEGFYLIGYVELSPREVLVFLFNPDSNKSEIGIIKIELDSELDLKLELSCCPEGEDDKCGDCSLATAIAVLCQPQSTYYPLIIQDDLQEGQVLLNEVYSADLNFSILHPIRQAVHKLTVCSSRVYFTDGVNPPRYLILEEDYNSTGLYGVSNEQRIGINGTDICPPDEFASILDEDKIRIFKLSNQPDLDVVAVEETGSMAVGVWQFAIAYADKFGNRVSQYYNVTNPVTIIQDSYSLPLERIKGTDINEQSNKSVRLRLTNVDSRFDYYMFGAVRNINGANEYIENGPYPIERVDFVFTGNEQIATNNTLSSEEFFQQRPVYTTANYISAVNDYLFLGGLAQDNYPNLQRVANRIKIKWKSVAAAYRKPTSTYKDGAFVANYRGYMRGETYPFGISFELADGRNTPVYHIPGRTAGENDRTLILNNDTPNPNPCNNEFEGVEKWKIYDTTYNVAFTDEWTNEVITPINSGTFLIQNALTEAEISTVTESIIGDYVGYPSLTYTVPTTSDPGLPYGDLTTYNQALANATALAGTLTRSTADPFGYNNGTYDTSLYLISFQTTQKNPNVVVNYYTTTNPSTGVTSITYTYLIVVEITTIWRRQTYYKRLNTFKVDELFTCKIPEHMKGEFGYWESTEYYPCDDSIWGQSDDTTKPHYDPYGLSGKNIRHHKFPDAAVVPHFTSLKQEFNLIAGAINNFDDDLYLIHPLGIEVDHASIVNAINDMILANVITVSQAKLIKGYKIVRGNRVNDASVIAKGLLYDMWKHVKETTKGQSETFLYPNYPYNDLRPDPFIMKSDLHYFNTKPLQEIVSRDLKSQYTTNYQNFISHPYNEKVFFPNENKYRYLGVKNDNFTFHSPEIHFYQPDINSGYLKLEMTMYGNSLGHYEKVADHAEYQRLKNRAYGFSTGISAIIALLDSITVGTTFKFEASTFIGNTLTGRQKLLDLFKTFIPPTQLVWQYNSVGYYSYRDSHVSIGNTRRKIMIGNHLRGNQIENVGDDYKINNLYRESSLYIKLFNTVQSPGIFNDPITGGYLGFGYENSRYKWHGDQYRDDTLLRNRIAIPQDDYDNYVGSEYNTDLGGPTHIKRKSILSYYGALTRDLPDQYGLIHTVDYCYTGSRFTLNSSFFPLNIPASQFNIGKYISYYSKSRETVFGGDIFITRFALKRKHSYFTDNRRGFNLNADINYSEAPNVGYPTYYFDTVSKLYARDNCQITPGQEGVFDSNISSTADDMDENETNTSDRVGANIVKNIKVTMRRLKDMMVSFKSALKNRPGEWLEAWNYEGNMADDDDPQGCAGEGGTIGETGYMYLHSYGIPFFFVETTINTDLRDRGINDWEDFYPHVGTGIPDEWLVRNTVEKDNYWRGAYNRTFSTQNVLNNLFPLPLTYSPYSRCVAEFPNRVIYSQQSSQEELSQSDVRSGLTSALREGSNSTLPIDNWLLYLYRNFYDFPKKRGAFTGLHQLPSASVMATFEDGSFVYKAYSTLKSVGDRDIYIGNAGLFSTEPQEMSSSILGYAGSQQTASILTEAGFFWVDAKRGGIFTFTDNFGDITLKNKNWFKSHLPFNIIKDYPNCRINNTYHHNNPLGVVLTYDNRFGRLIVTKRDYKIKPGLKSRVVYNQVDHTFIDTFTNEEVFVTDTSYFINKSFTMSYNVFSKEWVSFHSYMPNYYIPLNQIYLSNSFDQATNQQTIFTHLQTNKSYQIVHCNFVPFIVELPHYYKGSTDILGTILVGTEVLEYSNIDDYKQRLDLFFSKCVIWNKYQTTGVLNLVWKNPNNDDLAIDYPWYQANQISILFSQKDNYYTFNHIWNILDKHKTVWTESDQSLIIKNLNVSSEDYFKDTDDMDRMRGKESFVRLINDRYQRYKFKVYFELNATNKSIY